MSASGFTLAKLSFTVAFQVVLDNYNLRRADDKLEWMESTLAEMNGIVCDARRTRDARAAQGYKRKKGPAPEDDVVPAKCARVLPPSDGPTSHPKPEGFALTSVPSPLCLLPPASVPMAPPAQRTISSSAPAATSAASQMLADGMGADFIGLDALDDLLRRMNEDDMEKPVNVL